MVSIAVVYATGCPRLDAFACNDGAQCDLAAGGVCMDGWCAYPDPTCDEGHRWHGDAPGVGGTCVPLPPDPSTTEASSTSSSSPSTASSESSSSAAESSSGVSQCGQQITVRVDTMELAGRTVLEGYPLVVDVSDTSLVGAPLTWWADTNGDPLPHEIEAFDADTGTVRAWVRLPTWTAGEPLDILLRFGEPELAPANDPADVWPDGFRAVLHLDDPLTGGMRDMQLDSSGDDQHAIAIGDMGADQVVDGVVGEGIAFAGGEQQLQFVGNTFAGTLDSSTIAIWGRVDSDGTIENPFFSRMNGEGLYPRCRIRPDEDGAVQCQTIVDGEPIALRSLASHVPRGEWHHVAITFDASTGLFLLYVNGELVDQETLAAMPQGGGQQVPQLGRINEFNSLIGVLDELRVVDFPLPEAWIAADARSQRDPVRIATIVAGPEPIACP